MPSDDCPAREWARNATPEDVERLLLDRARHAAARAALSAELAALARSGHRDVALRIRRRFDDALGREIRIEDMTTV